ncbi:MAG: biotin/lipoyl-containing protein [Bryobacteraceae bacterium]
MENKLELRVPKVGMDTTEVTVANWLVQPGDNVAQGQPVVEVESEKVTVVIESEHDGKIVEIAQSVGETVPVGAVLCILEPR